MVRQCHSNTCPVGVCTQDDDLRARFDGTPEKVINLMTFIAEEVREILAIVGLHSLEEAIGRTDLLRQISRGAEHLDDIDLNPLLVRVDSPNAPYCTQTKRNEPPASLDEDFVKQAPGFFESGAAAQLSFPVRNTQRAIGARASAHVVRKFGMGALPEGRLTVRLRGSAGQSLGAFLVQGIAIEVVGDANDYVGKGLSGGLIALQPRPNDPSSANGNAIIGNTCLYGATSGRLFAAGLAGERFAVRNSGAIAVVEGCGANGCEYMTGGAAVILGAVGDNFGAGMTGGEAFVYDSEARFSFMANPDTIAWSPLAGGAREAYVKALIAEHVSRTGSKRGASVLGDWANQRSKFLSIYPKDLPAQAAPAADNRHLKVVGAP